MKFLIALSCALALASAGHVFSPIGHVYAGPQHFPVINGEGVPVDTADVQHARAAHLSQQATVYARNGYYANGAGGHAIVSPSVALLSTAAGYSAGGFAHGPVAYPTSHVVPTSVNGVPLNTPEVAAAAANHLAAHHEALARTAHASHGAHGHYRKRREIYGGYHGAAGLGLGYHGAAGLGLAYHGAAGALLSVAHGSGTHVGTFAAPQPIYSGPQHLPVINAEGVPVDTADVQHARAAHLSQKLTVQHRNGDFAYGNYGNYDGHGSIGHH